MDVSLKVYRITPLPQRYVEMKQDFHSSHQKEGFVNYQSPWIPVTKNNHHLLQRGDLVINRHGMEEPCFVGRDVEEVKKGEVVRIIKGPSGKDTKLVWVDTRSIDTARYLDGNPNAEAYKAYNEAIGTALRCSHSFDIQLVEHGVFPLFHETDILSAEAIIANGIDIYTVQSRREKNLGCCFFTATSLEDARGLGTSTGAMVEIVASSKSHPRWVRYEKGTNQMFLDVTKFIGSSQNRIIDPQTELLLGEQLYCWSTVSAELSASAMRWGCEVYIFDSFHEYEFSIVDREQ